MPIPMTEIKSLPKGWKESSREISRTFIHGFRKLIPGVYDWSCQENEEDTTFLAVIRDPKIRFFILSPEISRKVKTLISSS
jgi:hypothetical protein